MKQTTMLPYITLTSHYSLYKCRLCHCFASLFCFTVQIDISWVKIYLSHAKTFSKIYILLLEDKNGEMKRPCVSPALTQQWKLARGNVSACLFF